MFKSLKAKSTVMLLVLVMTISVFSFAVNAASNGQWYQSEKGWSYKVNDSFINGQWEEIGGKWYYFDADGIMESNCYRGGYWLTSNGAWDPAFSGGKWRKNDTGWWYQDGSWYPVSKWLRIDGKYYYFNEKGYMESNCYRDGCWLTASGAWDTNYRNGIWKSDSVGKWYQDGSWYPKNQGLWIDGDYYRFDSAGYLITDNGSGEGDDDIIELPFVPV